MVHTVTLIQYLSLSLSLSLYIYIYICIYIYILWCCCHSFAWKIHSPAFHSVKMSILPTVLWYKTIKIELCDIRPSNISGVGTVLYLYFAWANMIYFWIFRINVSYFSSNIYANVRAYLLCEMIKRNLILWLCERKVRRLKEETWFSKT